MENTERFKYKTRGEQIPQGIPKVFYCCHPKDFDRFFESVSDEILAKQNCAVFYDSTPEAERDEQFFLDLKQMQLFVMPVTSELLYLDNTALKELFPFAIENHIPVLPLMQESGLDKVFNEKCGDLQFLDKNANDITAISYDEKLEKYLSSVLIGDEMAEKIRNAFDAYVFLSYRKKDRKYAQELMRLIHKNDFCRDIAIWYDEFLTPGEDFNNAIEAALKKSGLFVLAVTPNLVNEDNYVMTTEYPKARDAGKLILPAELVETDKSLLAEKYEGIPDCTDAYNDAELSAALLDSIKRIAIKTNDNSPEHNFFIGLAYLGGVDVEVDHEKALELITFAADNDLVEAIEKLVEMYRTGHGVERDVVKTAHLIEKLFSIYQNNFYENQSEDNFFKLIIALIELCNYAKYIYIKEDLDKTYEKLLETLNKINVDNLKLCSYKYICAAGYKSVGEYKIHWKHYANGKVYIDKACRILTDILVKDKFNAEAIELLCYCFRVLGDCCVPNYNYEEAFRYYNQYINLLEKLLSTYKEKRFKLLLARGFNDYANFCYNIGDIDGAEEFYIKEIIVRKEVLDKSDALNYNIDYKNLVLLYSLLGNLYDKKGDFDKAKHYLLQSHILRSSDDWAITENDRGHYLVTSLCNLGKVCKNGGDLFSAQKYYQEALLLKLNLCEKNTDLTKSFELEEIYVELGNVCKDLNDYEEAAFYYSFCLKSHKGKIKKIMDVAICYYNLAYECKVNHLYQKAMIYYEKSIEILDSIDRIKAFMEYKTLFPLYQEIIDSIIDFCDKNGDIGCVKKYLNKLIDEFLSFKFLTDNIKPRFENEYETWCGLLSNKNKVFDLRIIGLAYCKLALIETCNNIKYFDIAKRIFDICDKEHLDILDFKMKLDETRKILFK